MTLTVDKGAVERAKKLDINISELTERILQSFAVESGDLGKAEERMEYLRLLAAMDPVLRAHGIEVPIGVGYRVFNEQSENETEVRYVGRGRFRPEDPNELGLNLSEDKDEWTLDEIEDENTYVTFETPTRIISNFIEKVNEKKRKREVALHELRVARNVLEAVLATDKPSPSPPVESVVQDARRQKLRPKARGKLA